MNHRISLAIVVLWSAIPAHARERSLESGLGSFLRTHVSSGHVDCVRITRHPDRLQDLIDTLEATDLQDLEGDAEETFLINAYNTLVIATVVAHYPIKSPLNLAVSGSLL